MDNLVDYHIVPVGVPWSKISPLGAKDVYIRLLSTLNLAKLISFYRPRTYICVLKVIRLWPWVFHFFGQGRIYTSSICSARGQRSLCMPFPYDIFKSFGFKNEKSLAFAAHCKSYTIYQGSCRKGLMFLTPLKNTVHVQPFLFNMVSATNTSNEKSLTVEEVLLGVFQMLMQPKTHQNKICEKNPRTRGSLSRANLDQKKQQKRNLKEKFETVEKGSMQDHTFQIMRV